MKDFKKLKKDIEQDRRISQRVIDEFLLYYAAQKDRLDKVFENRVKRYRHIVDIMHYWIIPVDFLRVIDYRFIVQS